MSNTFTKLTMAALLASASAPVLAAPGNGIRLGGSEGRLHPFVELEGRYDSNVLFSQAGTAVSDMIIHVRPGLALSVPGETTTVNFGGKFDWAQYLGTSDPASKDLSGLFGDAALGISVNPKGVVGFELDDAFVRGNYSHAVTFSSALVSNYNNLRLKLPWRPGGGALTLDVNGAWDVESFEPPFNVTCPGTDPLCSVSKYGYNNFLGGAGVAWKFLPRTSALLGASYFARRPNDATYSITGDANGYNVWVGVTGLVTPHMAATLKAGYAGINSAYPSVGSFLANAEVEWIPSDTGSVKLAYNHDLRVDPTVLYTSNKVSLAAHQLLAGRYALGLEGAWELLGYEAPATGTTAIVSVSPSVGVEVTRWLKTELAYVYLSRTSSTGATLASNDFSKNTAWLKVTASY